jgi:alpha/beta superfamily hydrolase
MAQLEAIDIPASHGILEGLLRLPDRVTSPPTMAAVVSHPHPLYGGTMHNKVAFRIAQALVEHGLPTLRFNFRGVGRSTGSFDDGDGERQDVRDALDAMARRFPDLPLCLGGVSFGVWVGFPVGCADSRVALLVGVGVPVDLLPFGDLVDCQKPKLFVQGEFDEYGPQAEIERWFERLPDPKRLVVVPGADHLFTQQQLALHSALTTVLDESRH